MDTEPIYIKKEPSKISTDSMFSITMAYSEWPPNKYGSSSRRFKIIPFMSKFDPIKEHHNLKN